MTEPTDPYHGIMRTMNRYCRALDYGIEDEWLADANLATAESAFLFLTRAADATTPQITAFGRYLDRFRNIDGVWRIAERICETEATIPA